MLIFIEIALLVLIVTMLLVFRSKKYNQYVQYRELKKKCGEIDQRRKEAEDALSKAQTEQTLIQQNLQSINENVRLGMEQIENNKQFLLTQDISLREQLSKEREEWFNEMIQAQTTELLQAQKDFSEQFSDENKKKIVTAQLLVDQISQLRATVDSAVEIAKHKLEEETAQDFYRLQLPQESIDDIKALRSIESLLHNTESINKIIWKVYYEKPYTDLIGRVGISTTPVCGIYKITNINNQMTYVGQAVNIAERWKQHIKRGIGADTPTQNKLYPAMRSIGPENFTFEIIEKCSRDKLNAREDYWQDFYKAKEFGYSIK